MTHDDNIFPPGRDPATSPASTLVGGQALSAANKNPDDAFQADKKKPRTTGLKLFDLLLYPFLTNFVVFGLSVGATYLTSKGGPDENGKLPFGKIGDWFHKRGIWLEGKFEGWGMKPHQAEMAKIVAFSYIDGTAISPMVKLLEDRREKIARWIDKSLGSLPADESVYDAEPKQGWLSVIGGRLATASIVVPTAIVLDKIAPGGTNLNDRMFRGPGAKLGKWVGEQPGISKYFGNLDTKELFKTGLFEAFYTSVCTAGLYFSSRVFAGWGKDKKVQNASQEAPKNSAVKQQESSYADRDIRPGSKEKPDQAQDTEMRSSFAEKAPSRREAGYSASAEKAESGFTHKENSKRATLAESAYQPHF